MKKLLGLIVAVSIVSVSGLFGQEEIKSENPNADGALAKKWALQVGLQNNFVTSFDGYSLSIKRQMKNRTALRMGLSFNVSDNSGPIHQEQNLVYSGSNSDSNYSSGNEGYKSLGISFGAQWIKYFSISDDIGFYAGGGPQVGARTVQENSRIENDTLKSSSNYYNSYANSSKSGTKTLGLSAVVGTEWFLNRRISMLMEYSISASYNWSKSRYVYTRRLNTSSSYNIKNKSNSSGYSIGSGSAKIGLSMYF